MLCEKYLFEDQEEILAVPPNNVALIINSHGSDIYGRILLPALASESERAPVAVMLHGYPGLEQNMDVPPALRRAGIATLYFSYRGVWGSHGDYCFSHLIEDVESVLAHLRANAEKYRIDPERIYLVGHSMGGFATLNSIAQGANVRGAVVMAPCDIGRRYLEDRERFDKMMFTQKYGYFNTPDEDYLPNDVVEHAEQWRFVALAEKFPQNMPLHFIGGAEDTMTPPEVDIMPLYRLLEARGMDISYTEIPAGHTFTAYRTRITRLIYRLIAEMESKA